MERLHRLEDIYSPMVKQEQLKSDSDGYTSLVLELDTGYEVATEYYAPYVPIPSIRLKAYQMLDTLETYRNIANKYDCTPSIVRQHSEQTHIISEDSNWVEHRQQLKVQLYFSDYLDTLSYFEYEPNTFYCVLKGNADLYDSVPNEIEQKLGDLIENDYTPVGWNKGRIELGFKKDESPNFFNQVEREHWYARAFNPITVELRSEFFLAGNKYIDHDGNVKSFSFGPPSKIWSQTHEMPDWDLD